MFFHFVLAHPVSSLRVFSSDRVFRLRKVAADDHELFMQQQTRNAEAYARKIKDVFLRSS